MQKCKHSIITNYVKYCTISYNFVLMCHSYVFPLVFSLWFYVKFVVGDISPPPSFKVTAHTWLYGRLQVRGGGRDTAHHASLEKKDATQATVSPGWNCTNVAFTSRNFQRLYRKLHYTKSNINITWQVWKSQTVDLEKSTSYHTKTRYHYNNTHLLSNYNLKYFLRIYRLYIVELCFAGRLQWIWN